MSSLHKPEKKRFYENYFLKAFLLGLGLSFLVFIPFIAIDGGRFLFYGDFNVQQVPFYQLAHRAIRSGNLGWNPYTDLGVNFIGSYSFYLLGSPFFWLTIPFPEAAVEFLMGPLLILKFAFAALSGYIYIHRYVKNQDFALMGAVLYAFSGFSVYNIFFNHFHEAIICFPLMLAALDEYMYNRRRGIFAISVAFSCIVNYYFFVGQVTFLLIYFLVRLACRSWKISLPDFLCLFLEAVLGVLMSFILLLPSIFTIVQNTRTNNLISGWSAVLYNKNQRYLHILECFFFPPDLPARPNFTPESESKWASLGAWLPMFGMTGTIAWLQIRRKHWLKKILALSFLMAFVPFLNSSFQLMNSSFYGRWYYMLTLMMALATIMALEYQPANWKRSIMWAGSITAAFAIVIGLMPVLTKSGGKVESITFGLMEYPTRFWTYVAISAVSIALVVYLIQFCRRDSKKFYKNAMAALSIVAVIYSIYFIALGKTQSLYSFSHIIPYALNGGTDITLPDVRDDNVRTDFYDSLDNSAMFWNVKSIQAFHSIVPGSVMDFYKSIDVKRDVASRPETDRYALRALTSVKWLFDDDHDKEFFAGENSEEPKMPGWIYAGNENGFDIWENEYYLPMGFCYDYYISQTDYDAASPENRELMLLKGIVLNEAQIEKYSHLLTRLPDDRRVFTQEAYFTDCIERSHTVSSSFHYTKTGFVSEINSLKENFIFFSVPYEPGWSATINGEAVDIEQVSVGFMGVAIPQGEKVNIEFKFKTPGLSAGISVTFLSVILLGVYLYFSKKKSLEKPVTVKKTNSSLKLQSFKEYCILRETSFSNMQPREFETPPPPSGFVLSEKDENS